MPKCISKIFSSDESIFRLEATVNNQNAKIWGTECPIERKQTFPHILGIIVKYPISEEKVIGPYFFEDET